jgi:hypothetical protein
MMGIIRRVRIAAALGLFVAMATAVCPLRMCFEGADGLPTPAAPGAHGHDDHEGPDRDGGCCSDVPTETGGPFVVLHLDLPAVRCAELLGAPRPPILPSSVEAAYPAPLRSTVLLR